MSELLTFDVRYPDAADEERADEVCGCKTFSYAAGDLREAFEDGQQTALDRISALESQLAAVEAERAHERQAAELLRGIFELRSDPDMSGKAKRFYVVNAGSSQRALEWLKTDAERNGNCCEHGDHSAPPGKRFCSDACARCEHESEGENGCDGICGGERNGSGEGT